MTESNEMKREDVDALAGELRDLKDVLREVSGKLGRIEKRLRVFFPKSFPVPLRKELGSTLRDAPPTLTGPQALDLYSELVEMARTGREKQVQDRVAAMGLPDLTFLVKELGAPAGKKPSRGGLTKSLMGRLRESIMLSRHTTRPKAEATRPEQEREAKEIKPSADSDSGDKFKE